jgi:hypothetical protein
MRKQVFISYRHESKEHAANVHRLGVLLRKANIPVELDQFYLETHPGGPDFGWPQWCEDRANESECVLIIASEGWFDAYEKKGTPRSGLGAATEADLFRQALWDAKGYNERIRLTYLHQLDEAKIPVRLRAWHRFRPFALSEDLQQLIRWIADRLGRNDIEQPVIDWPSAIPYKPKIADRNKKEWPAIVDLLCGVSRERILLVEGKSGVGKTELIRQTKAYSKILRIPTAHVDFKAGIVHTDSVLGQIRLDLRDQLPAFIRDGTNKDYLLREDLRSLRQPVLLIFDTYESAASNKPVTDWLSQILLSEVETSLGLAVIVAGQEVPDPTFASWRDYARCLSLEPILEVEEWQSWADDLYPNFNEKGDLRTLVTATGG